MKIIEINSCNYGSTGNIMLQLQQKAVQNGHISIVSCPKRRTKQVKKIQNTIYIGNRILNNLHLLFGKLTGFNGLFSVLPTLYFLKIMNKEKPNLMHLHNLHNCYIDLQLLFGYIKKHDVPVVWTLHDCWSFTGHCPHFTLAKCDKWKTGCYACPSYREYPQSLFDNSKFMWRLKKKWFTGIENLTIVTPSQWLAGLVKQSYLKEYPVKVINNGIDLSVFKPTVSDFRARHNIPVDKVLLLGVAFGWGVRKGLDVFVELSKRLPSDKYQIVLVGTNDATDKQLPNNIISIHRTQNQHELAEIYTAADLFVNPTREEVLGLVNIEAMACGTPGVTFRTGGSPECYDETCGAVVDCDDVNALEREIIRICETKPFTQEACLKRAQAFDMNERFQEYVDLYNAILKKE